MPRSEALKQAQKLYRERNKERIAEQSRITMRKYMKEHYDDEAKKKKREYYLKTRNYKNKEFAKDLIKLFEENDNV